MLAKFIAEDKKLILFCQSAQETKFLALILGCAPLFNKRICEMHSRMSQGKRKSELKRFKNLRGGAVLVSSDVGARGWDIDDVDAVIQLGAPSDNETYVHRVGRTARAGQAGVAILILFQWEANYLIKRFPRIKQFHTDSPPLNDRSRADVAEMVRCAKQDERYKKVSQQGYSGLLGFHNSLKKKMRMSDEELVAMLNDWVAALGSNPPPILRKNVAGKMHLRGTPGLRVAK
eukprot:TRINITY_DN13344_c0_g1_i1.p2 TRINITY_DN13344_c0_g1~~TRINITY_DN13344_c0_g1_i1.p2  ORF type:complete len:232 (+),score=37.63 TRINITY_DN13344_c0_g1_i1:698-1393(+)